MTCRPNTFAFLLLGLLFTLPGCKVGPDYRVPMVPVSSEWTLAQNERIQGVPVQIGSWWAHFQDPALDSLVYNTLQQNLTLRQAAERVCEARARRNLAYGNLFPQAQTLNGAFVKAAVSENTANFFTFPGVFNANVRPENWAFNAATAWELDFWGRFRRAVEASDASLDAAIAAYDDAMVILLAEIGNTYAEMRTIESRLNFARENVAVQRQTLELSLAKKEGGVVSALDVAQAESNLARTESVLPALETARRQACNRLCLLMARDPADLSDELGYTGIIPQTVSDLSFGIPADLVRRRPDIRAAERALAAQSALIGVAESDFYPHISLLGNLGVEAENFSDVFRSSSLVGFASPSFSWKILNFGRIRSNVEAEQAKFRQLCHAYTYAVKSALREAEDAQIAYVYGFDEVEALSRSVDGAVSAVEKATSQYKEGKIDFGRVYVLQTDLLARQDQLAIVKGSQLSSLIALFKALGGGWEAGKIAPQIVTQDMPQTMPQTMPQEMGYFDSQYFESQQNETQEQAPAEQQNETSYEMQRLPYNEPNSEMPVSPFAQPVLPSDLTQSNDQNAVEPIAGVE